MDVAAFLGDFKPCCLALVLVDPFGRSSFSFVLFLFCTVGFGVYVDVLFWVASNFPFLVVWCRFNPIGGVAMVVLVMVM